MANHKSALKEHRQSRVRRERNRLQRSRLRTAVKKFRLALSAGDADQASSLLPQTLSLLDRTAKNNAIHQNAASRTKARLSRALHRLTQSA